MARQSKIDPIRSAVRTIAEEIASELSAFLASARGGSVPAKGRRGRPPAAAKPCAVPSCGRNRDSRGLCTNHYMKARRLKMNLDSLGAKNLATLAQDGRSTRWSK